MRKRKNDGTLNESAQQVRVKSEDDYDHEQGTSSSASEVTVTGLIKEETPPTLCHQALSTVLPQQQSFSWRVLQIVLAIPRGKVASYGQCAALAGSPKKPRQVGKLLAAGLAGGFAPWQRVINAGGRISLPPQAGGARQRALLEAEGVVFLENGRVDVGTFWDPTPQQISALFA